MTLCLASHPGLPMLFDISHFFGGGGGGGGGGEM